MDRGIAVFGNDALRDQDRILEVVAVPRHERDSMFCPSASSPRSVDAPSAMTSPGNDVADLDHRALVDVRVLVRAVYLKGVDIDADFARHRLVVATRITIRAAST